MATSAKVGSWLSENTKAEERAEAYESDSGSESEASASAVKTRKSNGNGELEEDEDKDEVKEEKVKKVEREAIDWTDVLGKIKMAVGDKSPKRRQAFITRYLYVTDDCEFTIYRGFREYGR
jgi:hypothetical protein